ncbi:hypothetical protein ACLGIH_34845 [Streptomyces sp. HMX87]|uniref:hypothetical protein n=1 Tax=Streptomyces sp. HMX87 TaxID=3390849 RepID=UPI003A88AFD9
MDVYIEVQLDSADPRDRGEAVRQWFSESLSRMFSGLRSIDGVSWFASLSRDENSPAERYSGDITRQDDFLSELSAFPYWAQLEFTGGGDLQLARLRSSHLIDGGAYSSLSTAMQCGHEALSNAEYCAWIVESVSAAVTGANPAFGRIEYGEFSDRANLDIALRRKPEEFLRAARAVLRGYAWVTICPEELVEHLGGCKELAATGAFFRVVPLQGGGALLQATETMTGYSEEAMERVLRALAPALPPGMPRAHPAFPGVRFVQKDAAQFA